MKAYLLTIVVSLTALALPAQAADYKIDTEGAHASITFEIQHLGYSWLTGRFDDFEGEFTYDPENPENNQVTVNIDPASISSNHAERDKHLRGDDFLDVKNHPEARFVGTEFVSTGEGTAQLKGELTLKGVTQPVEIDVEHIGGGDDPWGGYRQGFRGTTEIALEDFDITYNLGPASKTVKLTLDVEGVRKN